MDVLFSFHPFPPQHANVELVGSRERTNLYFYIVVCPARSEQIFGPVLTVVIFSVKYETKIPYKNTEKKITFSSDCSWNFMEQNIYVI